MKAMVYHGNKDLRYETVDEPSPGPGEVKLRIDYCGICATDIEEYIYGPKFIDSDVPNGVTGKTLPTITGHELTGTVVEVGDGVTQHRTGERAAIVGVLTCGRCRCCRSGETAQCPSLASVGFAADGGLAEYTLWPASHVLTLPEGVTSRQAALVEPSAVAAHAVRRGGISQGLSVAVLGAGTVGTLAMQVAKAMGATVFAVDRRQVSLDLARDLGADAVINSDDVDAGDALRGLTDGTGPDVVIDAAGAPDTPRMAVEWVRRGGRVVLVAIYTATTEIDFNLVVATEKEVVGSIAYDRRDVEDVLGLIESGALKTEPLISDVIGLDEVVSVGFQRMMAPTKDIFRILVAPSRTADA